MPEVTRTTRQRRPKATDAKSGILGKIQKKAPTRPYSLLFYGPPGIGKTELLGNCPKTLFIIPPEEQGIVELKSFGRIAESVDFLIVNNWYELLDALTQLSKDNCGYDWIALDSMTWYQTFCWAACCAERFDDDWSKEGFFSFYAGPKVAAEEYWPQFVRLLDDIRDKAGSHVVCLSHVKTKAEPNPEGPEVPKFKPNLDDRTFEKIHIWAQGIYFMNYHFAVEKDGAKYKAVANSQQRYIYTKHSPIWDAKDRIGLSPMIEMGGSGKKAWANFKAELDKVST